jgi:hypothetical protein
MLLLSLQILPPFPMIPYTPFDIFIKKSDYLDDMSGHQDLTPRRPPFQSTLHLIPR